MRDLRDLQGNTYVYVASYVLKWDSKCYTGEESLWRRGGRIVT